MITWFLYFRWEKTWLIHRLQTHTTARNILRIQNTHLRLEIKVLEETIHGMIEKKNYNRA